VSLSRLVPQMLTPSGEQVTIHPSDRRCLGTVTKPASPPNWSATARETADAKATHTTIWTLASRRDSSDHHQALRRLNLFEQYSAVPGRALPAREKVAIRFFV